jgi:hypothetical protein
MFSKRTTSLWLVFSVALFLLLVGARTLVGVMSQAGPDVNSAYAGLGQALEQANLLPLGSADEFLLNLAAIARDVNTVNPKGEPAISGDILTLGNVIEARSAERTVLQLKLRPKYHQDLMPGALATALRKLSNLPRKAQIAAGVVGNNGTHVTFSLTAGQENYTCEAAFIGNTLDELVITKK